MKIDANLSLRLRAVSFFCALLVVPIHCASFTDWFAGVSPLRTWEISLALLLTDTISRCAVPCFFVLSGFFLALKYESTWAWYRETLCKRFVSLYVPFVAWNLLYLCRNSVLQHQSLFSLNGVLGYNLLVPPGFGLFWYVQVILFTVIFSPIWLSLLRNRFIAASAIGVMVAAWVTGNFGYYFSLQLSAGNFLWLFVGAIAAFNLPSVKKPPNIFRFAAAILLLATVVTHVATGVYRSMDLFRYSDTATIVLGVFTIFANAELIFTYLSRWTSLFSLSFFIYAMHPQGLLVHIPLDYIGVPFVPAYLVRIVCGIFVPIVIGLALRRYLPRLLIVLTGARG